jgi:hypothetical protein
MKHRILGFLGGRRRRSLLGVTAAVAAAGALLVTSALAVHDLDFQLDGDVVTTPDGTVGGTTQEFDWADFFNAAGGEISPLPAGFGASSFNRDFNTNPNGSFSTADSTTFATGSKDTLAITPGWQCNRDNNVLSKNDIMNAYSVSYTDPASGDEILYFGLERNANTGTADVGFWFLQDGTVNCVSPGGSTAFTGDHTDGDLLVVSEFTAGGTVSTIQVYRWNGGATGSLGTTAIASGVDCESPSTPLSDRTCATVNTGTIITPWLTANTQDGVGHSLRVSEFFEGGINLTDSGLGGKCFSTFLANTRSSTSLTATLFDFSRGQLELCQAALTTQVSDDSVIPGEAVHDTATVKGNRPVTPTGTVTFFMCTFAAGTMDLCDGSDAAHEGVSIGTGTLTGMGDTATAVSPDVNTAASPLTPGRYCFRAEWPGDANYPGALEEFEGPECFTVAKLDSQTVTTPVDGSGTPTSTISLGSSISDRAVVTGREAGGDPTGDVEFFVCGPIAAPATCDTDGTKVGATKALVSDGVATTFTSNATSDPFTPTAVGRYCFRADYLGSNIYLPSSDSGANECFTVTDTTATATHQIWLPNDQATITSAHGAPISGTLSFTLHAGLDCTAKCCAQPRSSR